MVRGCPPVNCGCVGADVTVRHVIYREILWRLSVDVMDSVRFRFRCRVMLKVRDG